MNADPAVADVLPPRSANTAVLNTPLRTVRVNSALTGTETPSTVPETISLYCPAVARIISEPNVAAPSTVVVVLPDSNVDVVTPVGKATLVPSVFTKLAVSTASEPLVILLPAASTTSSAGTASVALVPATKVLNEIPAPIATGLVVKRTVFAAPFVISKVFVASESVNPDAV